MENRSTCSQVVGINNRLRKMRSKKGTRANLGVLKSRIGISRIYSRYAVSALKLRNQSFGLAFNLGIPSEAR